MPNITLYAMMIISILDAAAGIIDFSFINIRSKNVANVCIRLRCCFQIVSKFCCNTILSHFVLVAFVNQIQKQINQNLAHHGLHDITFYDQKQTITLVDIAQNRIKTEMKFRLLCVGVLWLPPED